MRYSVLMSVYQKDDPYFLKLALKSIYEEQTRKPDEIVIVLDGRLTDGLNRVLEEFRREKEDFVFYCPLKTNRGLGEALRIGSQKCTGDYILRMDADDISDRRRFEKQIAFMERHPEVDVLGAAIAEFNTSPEDAKRLRVCPVSHQDIVAMSKKRNPMNHVTICMKKEALLRCGGYQTLLLLEDYYLWLRMIASGCIFANLKETLVYVRIGNGFHEKRGSMERIDGWRTLQNYMLEHKMISKSHAMGNMLCIWGFVNTPGWLKSILYSTILRNQHKTGG